MLGRPTSRSSARTPCGSCTSNTAAASSSMKIIAGDAFTHGEVTWFGGRTITIRTKEHSFRGEKFNLKEDFASIEMATQETQGKVKVGGAVGWGTAGALVAGPLGLLAGALLGGSGKKTQVVF